MLLSDGLHRLPRTLIVIWHELAHPMLYLDHHLLPALRIRLKRRNVGDWLLHDLLNNRAVLLLLFHLLLFLLLPHRWLQGRILRLPDGRLVFARDATALLVAHFSESAENNI